jgi:amino acid adenylation domain-containing protein
MRLIDLRGFTGERLELAWEQVSRTEATRPFRLDSGPLLRVVCATLKDDEYGVLLTMHHIVSDGWSLDVLNEEATEFYKQFQLGAQAAPPELSIQCADLALWARTWLKSEAMERELAYWRRQLANMASLELPADRPAPAVPTFRGGTVEVELGAELANSLKELGRAEGATLFMTLLAAYDLLLHRYAGQEDIAVGIPIANRIREESEKLIGFFVNTLVVRATVDPSLSFRDLLRRVRDVAAAAYANQALPFDKIVEHLHPERAATSTPLFRAMFALQSPRQVTLLLEGATVLEQELETGTCRSDLTLSVFDSQDSLRIALVYSQDMFDRQTVERLLDTFHVLLGAVLKNPEMPVGFVPIVSEAEERRHRFEWNDSHREYPKEKTFHELFVESAERNADAIAAFSEGECVSYRALNLRANQLAHHLRRRGVRAESVVGICMEKSIDTLVGMLGIVKAGGAYLPLDPELPSQRLEFMLRDSSCACVLTESRLAANVPRTGAALICVDRDWSTIKRESAEKLAKYATSGNLAYIIYTSGTTGKPKGTTITHRSLVNYCCWVNEYLIDNADTELPAVTKLSFDASIKQLLAPLLRGDKVWLLPADIVLQPAQLLAKLAERENVGLNCVPSLWKALLDQSDSSRVPLPAGLNSLLVGGEQVSKESIARTLGKKPRLRIVNLYGPSEATANASSAALTADSAVTIGRPIANTTIYLLDGNLGLAPEGWPGKLYIGGDGLARGYLNRPDLTAAKFIPDPFSLTPGARLYDSGDLARHAPNGDVVFLGRADEQVKVHGFRIELSEIESVLRTHRAVKEAIALAIEREPGEKQLAAFLVARNGDKPGNSDLRSYLRQHLPDYMIPAGFTWLDHMPLTPSGKIDRLAVLGQSVSVAQPNEDRVTPRSEYEAAVASIWADVLGVERVDVHDDFFALGGHSILAMLVTSKLREMFSVDLPVHLLFIAPTVAELAAAVVDQINEQKSGALADCVVA